MYLDQQTPGVNPVLTEQEKEILAVAISSVLELYEHIPHLLSALTNAPDAALPLGAGIEGRMHSINQLLGHFALSRLPPKGRA